MRNLYKILVEEAKRESTFGSVILKVVLDK